MQISFDNTAMCVNYRPATPAQLEQFFSARVIEAPLAKDTAQTLSTAEALRYPEESFPGYAAPMLVKAKAAANLELLSVKACFGLIPPWAKDTKLAKSTYNARSETVAEKPSFRHAWQKGQFCLVPMQCFFEPSYESGTALRWRIEQGDGQPFAVAGLWERWRSPTQEQVFSFTMLTINADQHALMKRFHKPGDEKRSIAVLAQEQWGLWLSASPSEAAQMLIAPQETNFVSHPDPMPAKIRKPSSSAS